MGTAVSNLFESLEISESGTLKPKKAGMDELALFQADVAEARDMESKGLLTITQEHPESQSGLRMIDLVTFRREA